MNILKNIFELLWILIFILITFLSWIKIWFWVSSVLVLMLINFLIISNTIKKNKKWFFWLIILLIFLYARFFQVYFPKIQTTNINLGFDAKLVVISDLHLGSLKDEKFLSSVVEKINNLTWVTAVLIPWDFTYNPKKNLEKLFFELKNLKYPVYATLWNHDLAIPGEKWIEPKLKQILPQFWVKLIENKIMNFSWFNLIWVGDEYSQTADLKILENLTWNSIVLLHNPDTIFRYKNFPSLTIAGHTHGWQVKFFGLEKNWIPTIHDWTKVWYYEDRKTFVWAWIWETLIPLRFFNPAKIDIIQIN